MHFALQQQMLHKPRTFRHQWDIRRISTNLFLRNPILCTKNKFVIPCFLSDKTTPINIIFISSGFFKHILFTIISKYSWAVVIGKRNFLFKDMRLILLVFEEKNVFIKKVWATKCRWVKVQCRAGYFSQSLMFYCQSAESNLKIQRC